MELSTATKPLAEYASVFAGEELVVLTRNSEPVAAVVALKNVDKESLALSTNPEFIANIEEARRAIAEGRVLTLEEMRRAALP